LSEDRVREKIALGIAKKPNPFSSKMAIHCLVDIKRAIEIITDAFLGRKRIAQYYSNATIHNILKHFHQFTESVNSNAGDLSIPKSRLFAQTKELTAEEEKSK